MTKLISDYAKVEISNKVNDILRMYHSSSWNSEPYHQHQNPAEGRYCTLKSWTNTIMNRSGAPADCWLRCMINASYILNHLLCESLAGNVPLEMLDGVSPDISILLLYTFYQPVFYATHNQSYPCTSEERAARWVGFGEHVGDTVTHKLLDDDTKKIFYRSAARPSDSAHPNKCFVSDGGESSQTPKPIVFVRSRQDNSQSATKPMAENMLVMPSPTNSLMMTPRKSSTDLLSDPQILPIPTSIWYLMEGSVPRPPNPLSLSSLGKIIVNLLPNLWQNTTLMILLAGPSYSQRMNKEKGLGPP